MLTFRAGTPDDSYAAFLLFEESLADLLHRLGQVEPSSFEDPVALEKMWQERRPLYEHLAATAENFWIAESEGEPVGYARSILRGHLRVLTELFVKPGLQESGVGKELVARAFQPELDGHRLVIGSPDVRAQALYMRAGVSPRMPVYYLYREPQARPVPSGLSVEPLREDRDLMRHVHAIDRAVLGHSRPEEHRFLLADRSGYLFSRNGRPVGYAYVGKRAGPVAMLELADTPRALAFIENISAEQGRAHFGLETPGANKVALDHLLASGFRIEPFVAVLFTDSTIGQFDRYIFTSPPFVP